MLRQAVRNPIAGAPGGAHVDAPVRGDPPVASGADPRRDGARPPVLARVSEQRTRPAALRRTGQLARRRARPAARLRPRDRARARPAPGRRPQLARVDLDEARNYLRSHHRAVLATMRRDGTPQMSPVTVTVDDDGMVTVSSRETAVKVKNLRR